MVHWNNFFIEFQLKDYLGVIIMKFLRTLNNCFLFDLIYFKIFYFKSFCMAIIDFYTILNDIIFIFLKYFSFYFFYTLFHRHHFIMKIKYFNNFNYLRRKVFHYDVLHWVTYRYYYFLLLLTQIIIINLMDLYFIEFLIINFYFYYYFAFFVN